jgi:hypothetical protein
VLFDVVLRVQASKRCCSKCSYNRARSKGKQHRKRTCWFKYCHSPAFSFNGSNCWHTLHKREHFCCTSKWWRSGTRATLAARGAALRGSRERPKVTQQQWRAHQTHGLPLKMLRVQSWMRLRGEPAAAQATLLQTLTATLSKSVAADKGGKC